MNKIESYSDYLIALRDQTAVLKVVQSEAIKALEEFRKNDPGNQGRREMTDVEVGR
jgi:hypothetical protein